MTIRRATAIVLLLGTAMVVVPGAADPGPELPAEALEALHAGRHWHASRILDRFLAGQADTTAGASLLAAEAAAGWGDWSTVETLLDGKSWLDEAHGGHGWSLLGRSRLAQGRWREAATAFERYQRVARGATARDLGIAAFRQATALAGHGDHDAALRAYGLAGRRLPQVADWIRLYGAHTAAAAGDTATAFRRLAGLDMPDRVWRVRVEARLAAGDTAGAMEVAGAAARTLTAGDRAAALTRLGRLQLARGDTAEARRSFRRAMAAAPGATVAVDAARSLDKLDLSPDDALAVGRIYLRHGNLPRAIDGLRAYLEHGSAMDRTLVRLQLGDALFRAGRFREAERVLLALAGDAHTDPGTAAQALYQAGRAQYRSGRPGLGLETFRRTVERFPSQTASAQAAFLLADLSHDAGDLMSAARQYGRVVELAPDIEESGLAQMRLAGMALLAGDDARAAEILEAYRSRYPDGRRIVQATYWAGRAYDRLGQDERARACFAEAARREPMSYYGIAAAARLGRALPELDLASAPVVSDRAEARAAAGLERIDLLHAMGAADAVAREVDDQVRRLDTDDGALYPFAEGLNARGRAAAGITIGWRLRDREGAWNPRLLRMVYPFPYREMVVGEAAERGLDPYFVAGLIRRESAFDADAVSPAGAVGLMQVMPRTGHALARDLGIRRSDPDMLTQPELNLHLGTAYLADLVERYDGRIIDVLVAYNAGPTRIARWRGLPEYDVDEELFIERIPFRETRDYVRFVQEHASLYRVLYGGAPAEGE